MKDGKWLKARVMAIHKEGDRYHVQFEDGSDEPTVLVKNIRKVRDFSRSQVVILDEKAMKRRWGLGRDGPVPKLTAARTNKVSSGHTRTTKPVEDEMGVATDNHQSSPPLYKSGEMVEVRFYGDNMWYLAKVTKSFASGNVDVRMEDGSPEADIEHCMVRKPMSSRHPRHPSYDKGYYIRGDYIEMKLPGSVWKRARVAVDHNNGVYDIRLEDSTDQKNVEGRWLRHLFRVHDTVHVRSPASSHEYLSARVESYHADGMYTVKYDDGKVDKEVNPRRICPASRMKTIETAKLITREDESSIVKVSASNTTTTISDNPKRTNGAAVEMKFTIGDRVEVCVNRRDKRWAAGKVQGLNEDELTYAVRLLDGDVLESVTLDDLRTASTSRTPIKSKASAVDGDNEKAMSSLSKTHDTDSDVKKQGVVKGSLVDARVNGQSEWKSGVVTKLRFNGTYDVLFDGDTTATPGILDENIRDSKTAVSPVRKDTRDRQKSVNGNAVSTSEEVILNKTNASHDIALVREEKVKAKKSSHKKDPLLLADGIRVAIRVEGVWVQGIVARATGPALYDVLLDNKRLVQNIPEVYIRVLDEKNEMLFSQSSHSVHAPLGYSKGSQVNVKPKGNDKYLPGVVVAVHSSNSYDVQLYEGTYLQRVTLTMLTPASQGQYVGVHHGQQIQDYSSHRLQLEGTGAETLFGVSYYSIVSASKWCPLIAYLSDNGFQSISGGINRYSSPGRLPPGTEVCILPTSEWVEFSCNEVARVTHDGSRVSMPFFMRLKQGKQSSSPASIAIKLLFYVKALIVGEISFNVGSSKDVASNKTSDTTTPSAKWFDKQSAMLRSSYLVSPHHDELVEVLVEDALRILPGFTIRRADRNSKITTSNIRNSQIIQVPEVVQILYNYRVSMIHIACLYGCCR
jgi:hypothetical protein